MAERNWRAEEAAERAERHRERDLDIAAGDRLRKVILPDSQREREGVIRIDYAIPQLSRDGCEWLADLIEAAHRMAVEIGSGMADAACIAAAERYLEVWRKVHVDA